MKEIKIYSIYRVSMDSIHYNFMSYNLSIVDELRDNPYQWPWACDDSVTIRGQDGY